MSIDIDYFTLHRLTEKAFRYEDSEKQELTKNISDIISSSSSNDEIIRKVVELVGDDLFTRKLQFASSTVDPKSALKPKGRLVRRVTDDQQLPTVVKLPSDDISEDEMSRRITAAKVAADRNRAFYGMIELSNDDDDDDDNDNVDGISDDEIESLMKVQIMTSKRLEGQLENCEDAEIQE